MLKSREEWERRDEDESDVIQGTYQEMAGKREVRRSSEAHWPAFYNSQLQVQWETVSEVMLRSDTEVGLWPLHTPGKAYTGISYYEKVSVFYRC